MWLSRVVVCFALVAPAYCQQPVKTLLGDGRPNLDLSPSVIGESGSNQPFGLVVGPDGCVYVCEVGTHCIRVIDMRRDSVTVFSGNGKQGYSGNGGPAVKAAMNEPYEIRFAANGDLYVVEMKNHIVRRVDAVDGTIHLVAGCGQSGFSGDGGLATDAKLNRPHSIALDNQGHLYICDIGNHRIRKVNLKTGVISTFAGTGQKKPTVHGAILQGAPLNGPRALDIDSDGNLILALREGNQLWRVDLSAGRLFHLAGTGRSGFSKTPVNALQAKLSGPKGVSISANGDVYFADTESHSVRVLRVNGIVETLLGDGTSGDGPDGVAAGCQLNRPHGVYVSDDGFLYVGDSNNHRIRVMNLSAVGRAVAP